MSSPSQELNARLGLREKTIRKKRRKRRIAIIAAILAVIAVAAVLIFSPVLATREVKVEGTQLVSAEDVIAAAQVPLETPLPRLPRSAIRERLGQLAPIAEVELGTELPHTLVIKVTERAMVYQAQVGPTYHWIDANGVDFNSSTEPSTGVIGVVDVNNEQARKDLAQVVSSLTPEIAEQTAKATWNTQDSIVLTLADGREINWGSAVQSPQKAALLPTLLKMNATWIDVSVPSQPAVR